MRIHSHSPSLTVCRSAPGILELQVRDNRSVVMRWNSTYGACELGAGLARSHRRSSLCHSSDMRFHKQISVRTADAYAKHFVLHVSLLIFERLPQSVIWAPRGTSLAISIS